MLACLVCVHSSCWAQTSAPGAAGSQAALPGAANVTVGSFKVTGNTLLDPALIEATLAPTRGQRSMDELRKAVEAVQRLYVDAGFGGVVVFLPPQGGDGGEILVSVIEGKLEAIKLVGAKHFSQANVLASVPGLSVGTTPRMHLIDSQISIANENPAKRLQVLLKPGSKTGAIDAELSLQDKPPQQFSVSLDNTGNERTGRFRAAAGWQHANLTGNDDVASAQFQTSPTEARQVTVLTAAYRLPLPARLLLLDAYLVYSDIDAGSTETAAGSVRITGRGNLAGLRGTWLMPRSGDLDQRLSVALDWREYLSTCTLTNIGSAPCSAVDNSVAVTPIGVDFSVRSSDRFSWTATVGYAQNLGLGGRRGKQESFTAVRLGAKRDYGLVRASAAFSMPIGTDWQLRGRSALQWARKPLVSGEQFGLGGAGSVRGYEERERSGDRGFSGSIELGGPEMLKRDKPDAATLRLFGFLDAGVLSNTQGAFCDRTQTRCSLAGTGVGLVFERDRLVARLTAAIALKDGGLTRKSDSRAHIFTSYVF